MNNEILIFVLIYLLWNSSYSLYLRTRMILEAKHPDISDGTLFFTAFVSTILTVILLPFLILFSIRSK